MLFSSKNLDGQTALGRSNVDESVKKITGAHNTSGMFYGSTDGTVQIKFCGIEDFWGNIRIWVDGIWSTTNTDPARKLWIATDEFNTVPYQQDGETWIDADPKPDNYIEYGTGFAANVDGYVKDSTEQTKPGLLQPIRLDRKLPTIVIVRIFSGCLVVSAGLTDAGRRPFICLGHPCGFDSYVGVANMD